jgi:hypothetical protein
MAARLMLSIALCLLSGVLSYWAAPTMFTLTPSQAAGALVIGIAFFIGFRAVTLVLPR